nr:hypothetical protein [Acholeplasmatales bacterium]
MENNTTPKKKRVSKAVAEAPKKKASKQSLEAPVKLKILVSIIDRKKVDFYLSALEGYEVNMQ